MYYCVEKAWDHSPEKGLSARLALGSHLAAWFQEDSHNSQNWWAEGTLPKPFVQTTWLLLSVWFPSESLGVATEHGQRVPMWSAPRKTLGAESAVSILDRQHFTHVITAPWSRNWVHLVNREETLESLHLISFRFCHMSSFPCWFCFVLLLFNKS